MFIYNAKNEKHLEELFAEDFSYFDFLVVFEVYGNDFAISSFKYDFEKRKNIISDTISINLDTFLINQKTIEFRYLTLQTLVKTSVKSNSTIIACNSIERVKLFNFFNNINRNNFLYSACSLLIDESFLKTFATEKEEINET